MDIKLLVDKQRQFYNTQYTKDVEHRLHVLKTMKQWIITHENEINQALKQDLNKHETESYMCEVGLTLSELSYQTCSNTISTILWFKF